MIAPAVPATRDADDTTDHELVARIRRGDDRAFECLYRRYHRRIASYIQGMVHDHARAEDITQDVFMSALRRMRDTDRPIAFKPWVYEIAKNACIDQFRRSRRGEEVSYDADEGLGSADYGRLVTKDPSPEMRFDQKQQLDHLRGAFGGLSETHHEILVMRELEGLSYREIGERLGMTRPAVESTLFRARRRLTEEYEELVTGERCQRVQGIIAAAGSGALGARDKRRVARHVSYCQPCLRVARASGMAAEELAVKPLRAKVAALLPIPAFLKSPWSAQLGAMDAGAMSSWGKAAATAATVALAGVGAGVATNPPRDVRAADGSSLTEHFAGDRASSSAPAVTRARRSRDAGSVGAAPVRKRGVAPVATTGRKRSGGGAATAGATVGAQSAPAESGPSTPTGGSDASGGEAPAQTGGRLSDAVTRITGSGGGSGGQGGNDGALRAPQLPIGPSQQQQQQAPPVQVPAAPPAVDTGAVRDTADSVGKAGADVAGSVVQGALGGQ